MPPECGFSFSAISTQILPLLTPSWMLPRIAGTFLCVWGTWLDMARIRMKSPRDCGSWEREIRGNHDKAASGVMDADDFNPVAKAAVDWTQSELLPEHLQWLTNLPQGPLTTNGIVLVHGAVHDEDEYVFTPAQALEGLLDTNAQVTFFGHTHHQGGFAHEGSNLEVLQIRPRASESFTALRVEPGRHYLLNPGSVGQPRDSDPRAAFAISDLEHETVEFWRVKYDIAAVQERMREVDLPEPLVQRLVLGR